MLTIDTRDTHIYPIMIMLSICAGLIVQYVLNTRRGILKETARLAALSGLFFSLSGGILLTLITSGFRYIGLSSLGGLAGLYAGNALIAAFVKRPYYLNILTQNCTLVLPLMYSVSKLGCLGAGCCRGIAYHGFGAVTYLTDTETVTLLPVQLLETISFAVIFAVGMMLYLKRNTHAVHIIFVLGLSTKFALDFLRESHTGQLLSLTQILCAVMLLTDAMMLLCKRYFRGKHPPELPPIKS
jgi:prolipoprotein diacylglyceryltransferase